MGKTARRRVVQRGAAAAVPGDDPAGEGGRATLTTAEEVDAFLLSVPDEVVGAALAQPDRPNLDRASHREGHLDQIEEALAGFAELPGSASFTPAQIHRERLMIAKALTPILNVSSFAESVAWFEKLGWSKGFQWGDPPTFGAVCSGEFEIFLCLGAQGGRGKSALPTTKDSGEDADKGVWISIWVDDVDAIHQCCLEQGLEVTMPPTEEPWGVREMHVRHPDGHVFRMSQGKD